MSDNASGKAFLIGKDGPGTTERHGTSGAGMAAATTGYLQLPGIWALALPCAWLLRCGLGPAVWGGFGAGGGREPERYTAAESSPLPAPVPYLHRRLFLSVRKANA